MNTVANALDIATLTAVLSKVERLIERAPDSTELSVLAAWLDVEIVTADAAQERYWITCEGRRVLNAIEGVA